ncbi:MAG: hypothetical protein LBR84_04730 [Tannerella sp.]|nr:hypothetical protein [Tannerella sp.]
MLAALIKQTSRKRSAYYKYLFPTGLEVETSGDAVYIHFKSLILEPLHSIGGLESREDADSKIF